MPKFAFTSTHGVLIAPDGDAAAAGAVHFRRDHSAPERDSVNHKNTYRFETDDAKVAEKVRAMALAGEYGIAEVAPRPAPAKA
jgi:hypothetical protein